MRLVPFSGSKAQREDAVVALIRKAKDYLKHESLYASDKTWRQFADDALNDRNNQLFPPDIGIGKDQCWLELVGVWNDHPQLLVIRGDNEDPIVADVICVTSSNVRDSIWTNNILGTGQKPAPDPVNHPVHYGGENNLYEAIKVIQAWLGDQGVVAFDIGNALKYICRAGHKDPAKVSEDLTKAQWYLRHATTVLDQHAGRMEANDAENAGEAVHIKKR